MTMYTTLRPAAMTVTTLGLLGSLFAVGCSSSDDAAPTGGSATPTRQVAPSATQSPMATGTAGISTPSPTPTPMLPGPPCLVDVGAPVPPLDPCTETAGSAPSGVSLQPVATGLRRPVGIASPPNDASRLFVVSQDGHIQIIENGLVMPNPFLDLRARTNAVQERGLLGLVFHPDFALNGTFFVNYTNEEDANVISRWRVSDDPSTADADSEEIILVIEQPSVIHNAGQLAFGPDGFIYIGVGDGGPGGDPSRTAQDLSQLLGKILRIDVDSARPYAIPDDNPFVGIEGARAEIWSYGFRNPWRFSFDRETGEMYIADVGETGREEVTVQPTGCGGLNFGWSIFEGTLCRLRMDCGLADLVPPTLEYDRAGQGASITGGFVYRGCAIPELRGTYFYADFVQGFVRSFVFVGGEVLDERDWTDELIPEGEVAIGRISSFGEDANGEMYICEIGGTVYRLSPSPSP